MVESHHMGPRVKVESCRGNKCSEPLTHLSSPALISVYTSTLSLLRLVVRIRTRCLFVYLFIVLGPNPWLYTHQAGSLPPGSLPPEVCCPCRGSCRTQRCQNVKLFVQSGFNAVGEKLPKFPSLPFVASVLPCFTFVFFLKCLF